MIVKTAELGELKDYTFVVIFCRYKDKWLYCRAKDRDVFETAGGHIEPGELPIEAAKRELYEETGATKFDIVPTFDYSVQTPSGYSTGQVYLAHINEIVEHQSFEMAEVKLFEALPDKMRFPEITPVLYTKMQSWVNLNSAKGELWDVYDSERNLTGRKHRRGDPLPKGDYHLVVVACLQNSKGEILITKRAPSKGYPNLWECLGGSAVAGDDSLTAVIRETKEESGLDVKPENGKLALTLYGVDYFFDIWLFRQDFDIDDVVLQENETVDAKYASVDEIREMVKNGEFVPIDHDFEFLEV